MQLNVAAGSGSGVQSVSFVLAERTWHTGPCGALARGADSVVVAIGMAAAMTVTTRDRYAASDKKAPIKYLTWLLLHQHGCMPLIGGRVVLNLCHRFLLHLGYNGPISDACLKPAPNA